MERTDMMDGQQAAGAGETQGARRVTGVSPARGGAGERGSAGGPEVAAKVRRRQFSPARVHP